MKKLFALWAIALGACAPRSAPAPVGVPVKAPPAPVPVVTDVPVQATASLNDPVATKIGNVTLTDTPAGLLVAGWATGLGIGQHGIHLHSVGRCQGPDFASAGPHFNPSNAKHGFKNPDGHHAGDMPNLVSPPAGKYEFQFLVPDVKLTGRGGLLDDDGAAVVIHSSGDDYLTDPAGNSGARFACGVITLVK